MSHNHLEYRRVAIEFALRHGDFREVRRHAQALRGLHARGAARLERAHRAAWPLLAERAEHPERAEPAGAREALLRDIDAADFDWLRRDL